MDHVNTLTLPRKVEADGYVFTECPRWHDGALYFSDIKGRSIHRLSPSGAAKIMDMTDEPAGLGFMPNGDLLIVAVHDTQLLRRAADGTMRTYADLTVAARYGINDMVVDKTGRAYVAQFGFDMNDLSTFGPSPIVVVESDGRVHTSPDSVMIANGMAITPDGRHLILAESGANRLSMYDIADDGGLSRRRIFATLPDGHIPDGICLDAEGGVWVACCQGPGFIRVMEGGAITHLVPMPEGRFAYACTLGGTARRTLYMCTAEKYDAAHLKARRTARIESLPVDIPGVGWP